MTDQHHQSPLGPEGSYFEDKERKEHEKNHAKMMALYPILITGLYLALGIFFNAWHPGWLLFITIPLFYMRPKTTLQRLGNPVMITLIYLMLGVFWGMWFPGLLIFFVIPIAAILDRADGDA